jgi:hypothetical protein
MGAITGLIGPAIGAASSLFGMAKGTPAQNVSLPAPSSFQLPNVGNAAGEFYSRTGALENQFNPLYAGLTGPAQQTATNLYNNPYAGLFQQGAGTASNLGMAGALGQYGLGQNLSQQGMNLFQPANAVLGTAFDPQQALYNRTLQQLQDQQRVSQAARGVNMTPYGAGLENQALNNFNIDWQNAQLARQTQGLGAAGQAYGQGANVANMGAQLVSQAPGQYLAAAALPYGIYGQIGQDQLAALSGAGSIYNTALQGMNTPLQNYLSYLNAGNQANQVANQAGANQINQAKLVGQQQQTLGNQFGQALQQFGTGWGNAGLPSISSSLGWGSPSTAWSSYNTGPPMPTGLAS